MLWLIVLSMVELLVCIRKVFFICYTCILTLTN